MIMGGFAAFKMVRSFQDRNNDRREVINDFIPQPSVTN
jgi:hypothetical protein